MGTSREQDNAFLQEVITPAMRKQNILEEVIDWIGNNITPDQVYTESQLKAWAEREGYTKEKSL